MKKRWVGIILMIIGVLWLCSDYVWQLSRFNLNALLVIPLLLLLIGLFLYVYAVKKESRY